MAVPKRPHSLFIFYVLVTYILVQFSWWAWLMIDLNIEVYTQRALDVLPGETQQTTDIRPLNSRIWMIAGEGFVFLLILTSGILQIRRSFKKEIALASQQQNFLMSITHELKSPIASAKLYLQTLRRHDLTEEKRNDIIQKTIKDTDRLNQLVENILTATRIENSTQNLYREKIDLSRLVREQIQAVQDSIGQQHTTTVDVEPDIFMEADAGAMSSIVLNLYENALKYSDPGTPVDVALKRDQDHIVLEVKDQGKGIANADVARIFDKFYRAGNEATRTTKGTGLGLYIVKRLTELHNGSIQVKPNQPKGSRFEVTWKNS